MLSHDKKLHFKMRQIFYIFFINWTPRRTEVSFDSSFQVELLKVSKFRKQIFQPKRPLKNEPTNLLFYPDYL